MKPHAVLAFASLAVWSAAGCASILGVDSDDYADAAVLLCACARDRNSCAAEVEDAITKDDELEQTTLDCLAEVDDQSCNGATVAKCVFDSGYCVDDKKRCLLDAQGNAVVGCCEGLTCIDRTCCAAVGSACSPAGGCCDGLQCDAATSTCKEASAEPECGIVGDRCDVGCCSSLTCGNEGMCVQPACLELGASCQQNEQCCEQHCRGVADSKVCAPS